MPRVNRRTLRDGLLAVGDVLRNVVKVAIARQCSGIEFADGETQAVAAVLRAVRVASTGRDRHPHAQVARRRHPGSQPQRHRAALTIIDCAQRERLPYAVRWRVERITLTRPVLHAILRRVRRGPGDTDGVDLELAAQIQRYPLRMVSLAGEGLCQIRITLPVGIQISVGESRIPVAIAITEATVRERCGPGMTDHFRRNGVADEVAFLGLGVTPLSFRIPVPGFRKQLGVLAVANGLPTRRLDFLDEIRRHDFVGCTSAQPVDTRTQRAERAEGTDCV